ncbi:hypothetical protein DYB30_008128 [Aphanomyces astaci]|uniref:DDE-1 domain-containing protein n=1 Tax=Aphanomyces astaci TaxID=112090 RepID=A0A397D3G4_APHAT|nr:hypothetical protein DYB30_008128 [Aphanomyces astaci]
MTLCTKLTAATRNAKRPTLGGQGAKGIIPFKHDLLTFMKDVRRDEHILTSMHMINFMKVYHKAWLDTYVVGKVDPYKSLLRFCQSFAARHRFSQGVPCYTNLPELDMVFIRNDFAAAFWNKYNDHNLRDIINADETAVYYDMPPGKIWAEVGKSSKVDVTQKHSDRPIAMLSCRADGTLPFVLEPLPPNCTSVCQPLDVGVMGPFKKLLRTLWLEETPVVTAGEKRLAMIKRSIKAWDRISADAIKKSFVKAIPRPEIVLV